MKKTCTITAFNRPHYLQQVLDTIRRNDTSGYTLYCALEPGRPDVVKMCQEIDWMPCVVVENESRLGVRDNPYNILRYVFEEVGSDFNLYLEDDVAISPDAFDLANWYSTLPTDEARLCLNLFRYDSDPARKNAVIPLSRNFNAMGIAIRAAEWRDWFSTYWYYDARGWDWSIHSLLIENPSLTAFCPAWSRSIHIGREGGMHCLPKMHDEMFGSMNWNGHERHRTFFLE